MLNNNLIEVTRERQRKNGTRIFYCKLTKVKYGSYKSGYVRRMYPGRNYKEMSYQLNPINIIRSRFIDINGKYDELKKYERVLIDKEEDRLKLIDSRSMSFKTYNEDIKVTDAPVKLKNKIKKYYGYKVKDAGTEFEKLILERYIYEVYDEILVDLNCCDLNSSDLILAKDITSLINKSFMLYLNYSELKQKTVLAKEYSEDKNEQI
jgi:hypothetical protein